MEDYDDEDRYDEEYENEYADHWQGPLVNLDAHRQWLPPLFEYQIRHLRDRQAGRTQAAVEYCPTDGSRLEPYVGVWRCSCGYRRPWCPATVNG